MYYICADKELDHMTGLFQLILLVTILAPKTSSYRASCASTYTLWTN